MRWVDERLVRERLVRLRVGLVGDRNDTHLAHRAIPRALSLVGEVAGLEVVPEWIATESIDPTRPGLSGYHALWCVPRRSTTAATG